MKPERARELYSDYAEETLSPALRLAMDQHFEVDPDARADYAEFARVYSLLDALEPEQVEVPLGFRAKVLERAAVEQTRREAAPAHRAALTITGWFRTVGGRRATGGVLAALAACGVLAVVLTPHGAGPNQSGVGPGLALNPVTTTITGVADSQDAGGSHYNFQIHLPTDVPSATVNAYVLTTNDQIADADERNAHATPALTPPQTLTNDESMEIPVTMQHQAPPGTTLNMLVQWTPSDGRPADAQVVFTPAQAGVAAIAPKPLHPAADFYDALQAIAADYGVTVIADAAHAPTQSVLPPPLAGEDPKNALQSVADQVKGTVQVLHRGVYQVSLPKP